MLVALVLACSLLAGYETAARKTRSWIHILGFAVIVSGSILLILDYEYPRTGLIRLIPVMRYSRTCTIACAKKSAALVAIAE